MSIYSLEVLLSQFGTSPWSHVSSNCCFLSHIQVSQEAGKAVWHSHLLTNFPQFVVAHSVKSTIKDKIGMNLEPDILEWEVKWVLGSLTMNKLVVVMEFQLGYFKYY